MAETHVTRSDLEALRGELKDEIHSVRIELKDEIASTRLDLAQLRTEMSERFGTVQAEFGTVQAEFGKVQVEFGKVQVEFGTVRADIADVPKTWPSCNRTWGTSNAPRNSGGSKCAKKCNSGASPRRVSSGPWWESRAGRLRSFSEPWSSWSFSLNPLLRHGLSRHKTAAVDTGGIGHVTRDVLKQG